ncbi:MAG: DUF4384 domain-containing protein [Thermodesulfobacteriota bacterium]
MCHTRAKVFLLCGALVGFILIASWMVCTDALAGSAPGLEMLSAMKPGAKPINIKAWTNKEPGAQFHEGDRLILDIQADRAGYLLVVSATSDGKLAVLVPNRETLSNRIEAGAVYSLFGDDSPVWLKTGKQVKACQVAVCISSQPFSLDPLPSVKAKVSGVASTTQTELARALQATLKVLAKDEGFNVLIFPIKGPQGAEFDVETLERPVEADKRREKKVPVGVVSTPPDGPKGTQGLKVMPERDVRR